MGLFAVGGSIYAAGMSRWAKVQGNANTILAVLALVIACSGGAFAAGTALGKNSVGSAQIKNGSIQMQDLSSATVKRLRGSASGDPTGNPSAPSIDIPAGYTDYGNGVAYKPEEYPNGVKLHLYSYKKCGSFVSASVNFLDESGAIVDHDTEYGGAMSPGDRQDLALTTYGDADMVGYKITDITCY